MCGNIRSRSSKHIVGIKDYKSSSYRYIDNERFIPIQRNFKNNCIKIFTVDSNKFMGGTK